MIESDLVVEHRYLRINGIRMHFVEKGTGPLVVLLHGFPELWWSWRYQIDALVKAGYRVIAPDLRGYNETDAIGPYDLETIATDVRDLIHAVGENKARIVGHDLGGAVAWLLAGRNPELVEQLVILNCPHPRVFLTALFKYPRQLRKSWYIFFFIIPQLADRFLPRNNGAELVNEVRRHACDPTNFSDEELAPHRVSVTRPGHSTAMVNWYRAIVRNMIDERKRRSLEMRVRADAMIIWGMKDAALGFDEVVPGTEKWVDSMQIVRIENCGHFAQQERPDEVNSHLVKFLRR